MIHRHFIDAYKTRYQLVIILIIIGFIALAAKVVQLQVLDKKFLRTQGDARSVRVVSIPAYRGIIVDRNGEPLAVTTPIDSVWANPEQVFNSRADLKPLAKLLNADAKGLIKKINDAKTREFLYIQRQVHPEVAEKIKALKIPGIYLQREYRRYYPSGPVTSHILGFTNVDDQGQEGLELAYDNWLRGIPGAKRVLKDRLGHVIENLESIREPMQGRELHLSIDRRLQYLAYRELADAVQKNKAQAGSVVILDITTGEILAMANHPSYNPNNRNDKNPANMRNRAVTDLYEPGSVMKTFSAASALESGLFTPTSPFDTSPGWLNVGRRTVRDIHNFGLLDLTGILKKSSNVGITKAMLALPPNTFTDLLPKLGFGVVTESQFPGERAGTIVRPKDKDLFGQAVLSFGYGLSSTTLQVAQAYAILGAGGVKRPVTFIKTSLEEAPAGERVLSEKTTEQLLEMLSSVVEDQGGSGSRAKIPGYHVTGKTGTTRKIGPNGYDPKKHRSFFVGMVPGSAPRFVMVVMIDEPQAGQYYGGAVGAPVFSNIMSGALRFFAIPPDDIMTTPLYASQKNS